MEAALNLGSRSLGLAAPNPAVGAILVKDGAVVGRGATAPGGRPHAERIAIGQAGEAARGATLYVTLEPCSHFGASPPCVDAVIAAGVARVVSAMEDPNPLVGRTGARAAESRGNRRLGRRWRGSGATRPSGPYLARDSGAAVRDAQACGDRGRVRLRRRQRCAPAHHRTDRRPSRPNHALDPRGDHGRGRDGLGRRSGLDRAAGRASIASRCASSSTPICACPNARGSPQPPGMFRPW